MLDIDGSEWMINKLHEIDTLVSKQIAIYSKTFLSNELQDFLLDKFYLNRFIIEIKGRNRKFAECRERMEYQCELLTKLASSTLKKCPSIISMHSELSVLVHQACREKSTLQVMQKYLPSTPEAVIRLENMSLNPSGKTLLAD